MDTTKSQVRSDFKHARELMRQADAFMKDYRHEPGQDFSEFEDMRAVANELIACVATFSQWVEDAQDAAEEAAEDPRKICINCDRKTKNVAPYGDGAYICGPCMKDRDMPATWDFS